MMIQQIIEYIWLPFQEKPCKNAAFNNNMNCLWVYFYWISVKSLGYNWPTFKASNYQL